MADSAYEVVADQLKTIIDTEFAPEQLTAIHDNLHGSLAQDKRRCGISPSHEAPTPNREVQEEQWIEVKFFDRWPKEINPKTVIDPRKITAFADRFKRAIKAHNDTAAGTDQVWFFKVVNIDYPNDPTGNKSRFVATIKSYGRNPSLVETIA